MVKKDSNFNPIGKSRGLGRRGNATADWASVDAAAISRAIVAASNASGALRFGYTPDGGAFAIGIYGDGDRYTEYVKPSENVEEVLSAIVELFESILDDQKRSKSPE
jgi:hypothetical protein